MRARAAVEQAGQGHGAGALRPEWQSEPERSGSPAAPRSRPGALERYRAGAPLVLVLLVSASLNGWHLNWGLPNGNTTWAADAVQPLTPLAIARKSFSEWNSGWFYFKYPIGHHQLLLVSYLPYLSVLYLTGQFRNPKPEPPYGFEDPEESIAVLALIGRAVSVAMGTASVWIVYALGTLLFDRRTAVLAAAGSACSAALVFYSHTTNLDVPVTFWMLLAVLFGVRLMREVTWRDCLGLGVAAGMGMATKESAVGMLVVLPPLIAVAQLWPAGAGSLREAGRRSALLGIGALSSLLVYGLATNCFYNPSGLYNRWRFLTNSLPAADYGELVPRAAYIDAGQGLSLARHLRLVSELFIGLSDAMSAPLLVAALCGAAIALVTARRAALLLLALAFSYYYFSLTALPLVAVRYVLPLAPLLLLFSGAALSSLASRGRAGRGMVAAILLFALAGGVSVDYLLVRDPRYAAEEWLAAHASGHQVETYNRGTFLPRMPAGAIPVRPRFEDLSIEQLAQRKPAFIVLSLADVNRVTGRYDPYEVGVRRRPENERFLESLLAEELGYLRIETFRRRSPFVRDGAIRSLNPEIVVFGRS